MGIYIKNLEMPTRGMVVNIYADGRVTNHFDEFGETIGKAVPVPPHGKLINADCIGLTDFEIVMCNDSYEEIVKMLLGKIEDAPTIIPAEEE